MAEPHEVLRKTPLHALHVELGAKMVPFAGYDMPVQYPAGVLKEHLHTREKAGLFDVSHMGQAFLAGHDPAKALERVTPADVVGLKPGMQRYGLLLNDEGTIKDDFMFSKLEGEADMYLVVNAGTKDGDYAYIADRLSGAAVVTTRFDRALLALQGPMAVHAIARSKSSAVGGRPRSFGPLPLVLIAEHIRSSWRAVISSPDRKSVV